MSFSEFVTAVRHSGCVWVQSWKSWKASIWTYTPLSLYLHQLMPEMKQLQCNSIAKTFCKVKETSTPKPLLPLPTFLTTTSPITSFPMTVWCPCKMKLLECNSIAQTWHKELFQALIWRRCTSLCYEALVLCCSWSQGPIIKEWMQTDIDLLQ